MKEFKAAEGSELTFFRYIPTENYNKEYFIVQVDHPVDGQLGFLTTVVDWTYYTIINYPLDTVKGNEIYNYSLDDYMNGIINFMNEQQFMDELKRTKELIEEVVQDRQELIIPIGYEYRELTSGGRLI